MFFCLEWRDYRIQSLHSVPIEQADNETYRLNYPSIKLTDFNQFWQPKVDFRNAETLNYVHSLNQVRYLEVWPESKHIKMCSHISAIFTCYMNLSSLPFDQQFCNFELQTVQNSIQRLQLSVRSMKNYVVYQRYFRVKETYIEECGPLEEGGTINESENQQCVLGGVRLVRRLAYYVLRYYCPTFLTGKFLKFCKQRLIFVTHSCNVCLSILHSH